MPEEETTPPIADDDDALAERLLQKREERIEEAEEKDSEKTGDSTYLISQNKMLGLPEKYTVGRETFTFVPIPNGDMAEARNLCYRWPRVFLFAAMAEPSGENGGIDFEVVTKMMSASNEADGEPPVTVKELKGQLRQFVFLGLSEHMPRIIDTVLFVSPKGTTRDEVAAKIDKLLPSQLPDLLRAVMDSFSGYPGDEKDHFE